MILLGDEYGAIYESLDNINSLHPLPDCHEHVGLLSLSKENLGTYRTLRDVFGG